MTTPQYTTKIPYSFESLCLMESSQDRRLLDMFAPSPDVRANPVWGTPRETGNKYGITADGKQVCLTAKYRDPACLGGFHVVVHNMTPRIDNRKKEPDLV